MSYKVLNLEQYLLAKLAEECAEIAQMALKSSYFGLDEVKQGGDISNRQRLNSEIDDLLIILTFMQVYRVFEYEPESEKSTLAKKLKIEKYWDLATFRGNVVKREEHD